MSDTTPPTAPTTIAADSQVNPHHHPDPRDFSVAAARLLADFDCEDVLLFDVTGIHPLCRFLLLATGTSDRQVRSLAGRLSDLAAQMGQPRLGIDGDEGGTWLVIDFVDVMAHLFEPATRGHYDLEMLWGDAQSVHWRRESR